MRNNLPKERSGSARSVVSGTQRRQRRVRLLVCIGELGGLAGGARSWPRLLRSRQSRRSLLQRGCSAVVHLVSLLSARGGRVGLVSRASPVRRF